MHPPRIAVQGALFTTPVSLAALEPEDRTCPICHELYVEATASTDAQVSDQEWPVSVDMVAEQSGPKRCCGHVLGRRCLEKHLKARGDWRNKSPICRDIWFGNPIVSKYSPSEEPRTSAQRESRSPSTLRRSSRIALRATARRSATGIRTSDRHRVFRLRQRVQTSRSMGFMQQLLDALEVELGSDEVKGTLEEVEEKLDALYDDLRV